MSAQVFAPLKSRPIVVEGERHTLARPLKWSRLLAYALPHTLAMSEQRPPSSVPALIGLRELAHRLKVDERTLRRWIKAKAFPPPLRIGCAFRWREGDILEWLSARERAA